MRRRDPAGSAAFCRGWLIALLAVHLVGGLRAPVSTSSTAAGNSGGAAFSADGTFVVFVSDADNLVTHCNNGPVTDVFLRDLLRGQTELISVSLDGLDGGNRSSRAPAISANGRWIVFESAATNLVEGDGNDVMDVFLHDRTTGRTRRISSRPGANPVAETGPGDSRNPVVTPDGQWVFFDGVRYTDSLWPRRRIGLR